MTIAVAMGLSITNSKDEKMDFTLTREQQTLQETVRRFAQSELADVAKQVEREDRAPSPAVMKRFAEMGLLGINIDARYGGGGMSHFDAVLALEEVAKISIGVAFPVFEACFGPTLAIAHFAPEAMKDQWLPRVCAGKAVIAVSMSEPQAGSALTDLTTKAVQQGDKLILNGQKRWCSGAGHADAYVVYCKLSDKPGAKGIGAVLVEKGTAGFNFGAPEQHMGFRGVASADMFFDDVELPLENIIVPAGGFRQLMEAFDLERCGNTTMSLAVAQSAFDYVFDYVQERQQFGKALDHQGNHPPVPQQGAERGKDDDDWQ